MDQAEMADRTARFVALQGADQVPLHSQITGGRLLLERLLDPVFSDVVEPRCQSGSDGIRPVRLGHTDDPHLVPPSPRCLASGHSFAH
jgi:hypothetical protein